MANYKTVVCLKPRSNTATSVFGFPPRNEFRHKPILFCEGETAALLKSVNAVGLMFFLREHRKIHFTLLKVISLRSAIQRVVKLPKFISKRIKNANRIKYNKGLLREFFRL